LSSSPSIAKRRKEEEEEEEEEEAQVRKWGKLRKGRKKINTV
jgi:hypothetical protein